MNQYYEAAQKIEEGMKTLGLQIPANLQHWIELRRNNPLRCTGKTKKMLVDILHRALHAEKHIAIAVLCKHACNRDSFRESFIAILKAMGLPYESCRGRVIIEIPTKPYIHFCSNEQEFQGLAQITRHYVDD